MGGAEPNIVAYEIDIILGVVALVAVVVGIIALVAWIVAPRAGAPRRVARGLLRLWVTAIATAALCGLIAFIVGRDALHLF